MRSWWQAAIWEGAHSARPGRTGDLDHQRPAAQADRQFVPSPTHFRLLKQRSRIGLDLIEQLVGGHDAVFGDEKPGLEQIVFRTGGMAKLAHVVTTSVAVRPVLPGRVA